MACLDVEGGRDGVAAADGVVADVFDAGRVRRIPRDTCVRHDVAHGYRIIVPFRCYWIMVDVDDGQAAQQSRLEGSAVEYGTRM